MAKIRRTEDLPKWFSLENYEGCETFGTAEWLEQLERRRELLDFHPARVSLVRPEDSKEWNDFTLMFWKSVVNGSAEKVRLAPLESPSRGKFSNWLADRDSQPIREVRAIDLAWQSGRDLDAERNGKAEIGFSQRWKAISPETCELVTFSKWANAPLSIDFHDGSAERPILEVDLGASDAVLKDAFATWLKGARESSEKRARPMHDRWARYGLLPYLDLFIWSMETEIHIPDRVMSAAISSYDTGEANLRKTIAPLAKELMRDLTELRAYAAVEAASKHHQKPESFLD